MSVGKSKYGKAPNCLTFFDATHKKKDGRYVDQNTKGLMVYSYFMLSNHLIVLFHAWFHMLVYISWDACSLYVNIVL